MDDQSMNYYVLRTITGKEQDVETYIESMRDAVPVLKEHVGEVLVPMETYYQLNKSAKGGRVERTRPYYSGYVFVQARLVGETQFTLRRIPNVLGFLGSDDDHPEILSQADVDQMKSLVDELTEAPDATVMDFSEGERVKVVFGPFAGFFGEVTEVLEDRKKLKILVKVFGRETSMEVDFVQVEKESLS
ncbi:MAG: transcription termination/antitermination protein NusG [Porphyromonas sp.]|nr:transcription termination/antitermination protein NusG [Porphyromonas sp.]